MAPKSAKRAEKEPIEKDAAPKAAKEDADQTAPAAAAAAAVGAPEEPKLADAVKKSEAQPSEPVNASLNTEEAKAAIPEGEPKKTVQGEAVADKAATTEANGTEKKAEVETATAAGVEAGKTKEHEEPKAAAEGKNVVEPGIGEAKPVAEAE